MNPPSRATTRNLVAAQAKSQLRRVSSRTVPCPSCEQPVGQGCVAVGDPRQRSTAGAPCSPHSTRARLAVKRDNEQREREGTLTPIERTPGAREDVNGSECPECGLSIRVSPFGRLMAHTVRGGATSGSFATGGPRLKCLGSGTRVAA